MFTQPIVFVVGAGASHEYRLPLGTGLRDQMVSDLNFIYDGYSISSGSNELFNLFKQLSPEDCGNALIGAGQKLSPVLRRSSSVDEAIHYCGHDPDVVRVGKLSIGHTILRSESNKLPLPDGRLSDWDGVGGWLPQFLTMVLSGRQLVDERRLFENVSIVNFNYDRTIEHYLRNALQRNGLLSQDLAADEIKQLTILRPYGSLGPLPWQNQSNGVEYGTATEYTVPIAAKNLRTYTEQLEESSEFRVNVIPRFLTARVIVFLGFGYNKENLKLLAVDGPIREDCLVIGTRKSENQANEPTYRNLISKALRVHTGNVHLFDLTANELLSQLQPMIVEHVS